MFKKKIFEKYKQAGMSINEASAELGMIFDYLNINPLKDIMGEEFSKEEEQSVLDIIERRIKTQIPLQYITGFGYFMGEKYNVDNSVLIPRPETEILVRECSKLINKNNKILDIGTGSGCIAISLAKITGAKVDAVDISDKALSIAKKNAKYHHSNCNFFKSDLFSNVKGKYDLIVSNPPYIPKSDINTLSNSVKNFEPHAALFTNDEIGIEFYKKIIQKSVTFLNNYGFLCFELGQNQSKIVAEILKSQDFSGIQIIKDLDNNERVTIAQHFEKKTFQDNL